MQAISKVLFGIANSLLIPDIVLLILFFVWALIILGATYAAYMNRRKNQRIIGSAIKELTPQGLPEFTSLSATLAPSTFSTYLSDLLGSDASEDYADWLLGEYESVAARELNTARLLTKVGPVLGLMGTLISMSPALVGLSTGDISGMAYNMQVVFSTTVLGLVISIIGLFVQQVKQRWFAADVNNLDRVARVMSGSVGQNRERSVQQ